jgi:hypothetical protein
VDRHGKEVQVINRPLPNLAAAYKLPNGQIALLTSTGGYLRIDDQGKELHRYQAAVSGYLSQGSAAIQFLPHDHVLLPSIERGKSKLVEIDGRGQRVREVPMPTYAMSAQRLANGHTLLANTGTNQIIELDRKCQTVWEYTNPNIRPYRVHRWER